MRNLKKFMAVVVAVAIMVTAMVPAFAAESFNFEDEANALNKLGLYAGTSTDSFNPALDQALTREAGIVLLVAMFGLTEDAKNMSAEEVDEALAKYTDKDQVSSWAKNAVAYTIANGYVGGTSKTTIGPKAPLLGKQLATIILNRLGYAPKYDVAAGQLAGVSGLGAEYATLFNSKSLVRDDAVGIFYGTLTAKFATENETVIEKLIAADPTKLPIAEEIGVVAPAATIKSVAAVADVAATVGDDVKAKLPKEVDATYSDSKTAKVAVEWDVKAVDATKAGTYEATGTIKGFAAGVKAKVVVSELALAVDSVSTNNLKEVVVKFNKTVDADKAATVGNYTVKVGSTDKGVAKATVAADKLSVTLTLTANVAQQDKVDVTVKKDIGLAADVTKSIDSVIDTTLPVAESIKLTGPNTMEVTFSEPVKASSAEVLVNNGIYGVTSAVLSADFRTLTVTLSASTLTNGTYSVKVSGYADYANFTAMSKTFDVVYAKDTTAPTVELVSATQKEVKVKFNKEVKFSNNNVINTANGGAAYFYQTYTAWKPYTVTTSDNKEFTLSFDDSNPSTVDPILPEGNVVITVLKEAVTDKKVVDLWGNAMAADAKLTATISADKEAPTVAKVEATAEDKIEVTFSEDVDTVQANYTIKDSAAKAITQTISAFNYVAADKKTTITLSSKLAGGVYTIEVKDVADKSLAGNKIVTVTKEFSVTDKTAPTVSSAVYVNNTSADDYVYITYSEAMATTGTGSIIDKNNYRLNGAFLADAAKVELFGTDNKKVKVTLPDGTNFATATLTVGRVSDTTGNFIVAFQTNAALDADAAPKVTAVNVVDKNKVEIVVDKILTTVSADGFTVTNGAYGPATLAAISFTTDTTAGTTTVVGTLKADVSLAGASSSIAGMALTVVADKIKSETGKAMDSGLLSVVFTDKYAPSFSAIAKGASGSERFTITFDENVTADNGLAATELVIVDKDGKTLTAINDYTVSVSGANVTVTLTKDGYTGKVTVSTKDTVNYIKDINNNVINKFSAKEVTLD
ncbi:MAG: Ig-like domain-containing protein [Clostridia bacterium]|nr:Ig-like domain-containing protein [Clostridia bacterium]